MVVDVNRLPFPKTIGDNTLIYAPSNGSKQNAEHVMLLVNKLGFSIANTGLSLASKQSFTAKNMGLYLISNDVKSSDILHVKNAYKIPLISEYSVRNCLNSSTLVLLKNGHFHIEEDVWDASN
ncbi:hypothetical protein [Thalassotalea sediminis]|uniref:hypothetical protein n=1 Tax=Thalassotalea sediminis TaxID=1759089 RepID=UPI002573C4F4|nr:hypothetical protein [Thalassotalea sediminis]